MKSEEFRTMRRFKQELSSEEIREVLKVGKRGVLSIQGDGGYPYAIPMNYIYEEQESSLYFHSAKEGHKIDAIKKNNKASFCIFEETYQNEDGWSYYVNSVVAFGRVSLIEDADLLKEKLLKIGMKYYPSIEIVMDEMKAGAHRVAVLEFRIDHMTGKLVHEK